MEQNLKYLTVQELLELTDLEKQKINEIGYDEFLRRRQYPRNELISFRVTAETAQRVKKDAQKERVSVSKYLHNFFYNDQS